MLEDSAYVRATLIDFTKAFDIADHTALMSKLAELQLPGIIHNCIESISICSSTSLSFQWYISYCKLESSNLSFVQGSGLGLTLFLVLSQDLNTSSSNNELIKFADDSTLLVPENSDISVAAELSKCTGLGKA